MNHLSDEQLNEYLDHESPEGGQIELHLSACDVCAARFHSLEVLFSELGSLPEISPSRDLTVAVLRSVSGSGAPPAWLRLTLAVQAALALTAALAAAPLITRLINEAMPVLQTPPPSELFLQAQAQWMAWLDALSTIRLPLILIPTPQFSSVVLLFSLAGACMLWLVGNGLLLRNQIK